MITRDSPIGSDSQHRLSDLVSANTLVLLSGPRLETRFLSACLPRRARRSGRGWRRSFFERRQRRGILSMMPGSCRQFTKTDGAQFATQRLLADRDAEFVEHPLRQVD